MQSFDGLQDIFGPRDQKTILGSLSKSAACCSKCRKHGQHEHPRKEPAIDHKALIELVNDVFGSNYVSENSANNSITKGARHKLFTGLVREACIEKPTKIDYIAVFKTRRPTFATSLPPIHLQTRAPQSNISTEVEDEVIEGHTFGNKSKQPQSSALSKIPRHLRPTLASKGKIQNERAPQDLHFKQKSKAEPTKNVLQFYQADDIDDTTYKNKRIDATKPTRLLGNVSTVLQSQTSIALRPSRLHSASPPL